MGWAIDIDQNNNFWLALTNGQKLFLYKTVALDSFVLADTISSPFLHYQPHIKAFDSNNVWIDAFVDGLNLSLTLFYYSENTGTQIIDTTFFGFGICTYALWPKKLIKTESYKLYVLRDILEDCSGSDPIYYTRLFKIENNNISLMNRLTTAAITDSGKLYFLSKEHIDSLHSRIRVEIYDTSIDTVIYHYYIYKPLPLTLSRFGSYLGMGKIKNDSIFIKGIVDSFVYKTTIIPDDSLLGDHNRQKLCIFTGMFPQIYLSWNGKINNQNEIFFAEFKVSTELDTESVVKLPKSDINLFYKFQLNQNYPNPFNSSTRINFELFQTSKVNLAIYDILGKRIKQIVNRKLSPGQYSFIWRGRKEDNIEVSSGVYFYRLQANGVTEIRKMLLIK